MTTKLRVTYRAHKEQEHRHAMVNTLTACCPGEASVYLASSSILFHSSYSRFKDQCLTRLPMLTKILRTGVKLCRILEPELANYIES